LAGRWEKLAVEAHIRGCLDFREPHRFDWRWDMKERLVMEGLEDSIAVEVNKLAHAWHCAAAQVTGWDEKETLFNDHSKQVRRAYNLIGKSLLPWYKQWSIEEKSLAQMWRDLKEEEKDPEYAKVLQIERDKLFAKVKEAQDDMKNYAEGMRLMKEREEALKLAEIQRQERMLRARLRRS
jgi:hypothetical protein